MINVDYANLCDLSHISIIEQRCFSRPWLEESLAELLQSDYARVLVARDGNNCVGYIGAHLIAGECEIMNIGVLPEYRRQGIASALLYRFMAEVTRQGAHFVSLEVRASNEGAIALYRKYGFETAGRRKNYYTAPTEDAIILRVDLCPSP